MLNELLALDPYINNNDDYFKRLRIFFTEK